MVNDSLLWILGCSVAFVYLVGPVIIYFIQKIPATPRFELIAPEQLPPQVSSMIIQAWTALEPAGFALLAYLSLPNHVPNVYPVLAYCINPKTKDKALLTSMYVMQEGQYRLKTAYMEFSTRFDDGTSLATNNNSSGGSLKPDPRHVFFRFPAIGDTAYLYRIHRVLLEKHSAGRTAILPAQGEEINFLAGTIVEDCQKQVEYGRLKFDSQANIYRPTFIGAYLMTWSQLWPMTAIRKYRRDKLAAEVLRSLDLTAAPSVV